MEKNDRTKKKKPPFAQIPNKLLNDCTISWKAKGLYAYLYSKPDDWNFSAKRIHDDATDGYKATYSGILELEKGGYISRQKHANGRTTYHLWEDTDEEKPSADYSHQAEKPGGGFGYQPKRLLAKTATISNKEVKVIKSNSNKDINHQFEKFWKAYPRKVAKKTALRAWTKLNPDQNLFNDIIGGLEDYKKTQAWQKDGGSFIPHPTTFLNQERYYDEIVPQKEIQQRPVRTVTPTRPPLTENQKQKMATIRSGSSNLAEKMRM